MAKGYQLTNDDGSITINEEYTMPATDGTPGQVLATDGTGGVTFSDPLSGTSGVWTPTLTDGSNVVSSAAFEGQWMQVGSVVTCSFFFSCVLTSDAGVSTSMEVSPPVATNFPQPINCCGTGFVGAPPGDTIGITADTTNDTIRLDWYSNSLGAQCFCHCTYRVQ